MGTLDARVAIVTGGARGQGAAEARLFADEGATVFVTDVLTDEGAKTAAEIGGTFVEHDVTDPAQWSALVDACRRRVRPPRHPDQQRGDPAVGAHGRHVVRRRGTRWSR